MFPDVDTGDPEAVLGICRVAWKAITGREDGGLFAQTFYQVQDSFAGRHPDYEPLDTRYHDLEHTLQGTLCLVRLLTGWHDRGGQPTLDERAVRLGLIAILLHDTGYLKDRGDLVGTGAKFTPIHVQRSADFAARMLHANGFSSPDILEIQGMIRCTGVHANVRALVFERALGRRVGCALATADLLGQMAARDYVDKLPALYAEFAEAATSNTGPDADRLKTFRSAEDLIRRTPEFWEEYVRPRLNHEFEGVYRYLDDPYPDGFNWYLARIEANLDRIRSRFTPAD